MMSESMSIVLSTPLFLNLGLQGRHVRADDDILVATL